MRPIFLTLAGAILIMGGYAYWWNQIADTAVEQADHWKKDRIAAGYVITNSAIEISGFPYRVKLSVDQMTIKNPEAEYSGEMNIRDFWILAQPWNISHVIFGIDGPVETQWKQGGTSKKTTISSSSARGSATFDLAGKILNAAFDMNKLVITSSWRAPALANRIQVHSRPAPILAKEGDKSTTPDPAQQIAIQMDQLDLGEDKNNFGNSIFEKVILSAILQGNWQDLRDKSSLITWRDKGGIIDIQDITAHWGGSQLTAKGTVALDDDFRPIGAFTAHIVGFNPILNAMVQADKLDKKASQTVAFVLKILAKENEKGERYLDIPLTLQEGGLYLGPLFLMPVDPLFN